MDTQNCIQQNELRKRQKLHTVTTSSHNVNWCHREQKCYPSFPLVAMGHKKTQSCLQWVIPQMLLKCWMVPGAPVGPKISQYLTKCCDILSDPTGVASLRLYGISSAVSLVAANELLNFAATLKVSSDDVAVLLPAGLSLLNCVLRQLLNFVVIQTRPEGAFPLQRNDRASYLLLLEGEVQNRRAL